MSFISIMVYIQIRSIFQKGGKRGDDGEEGTQLVSHFQIISFLRLKFGFQNILSVHYFNVITWPMHVEQLPTDLHYGFLNNDIYLANMCNILNHSLADDFPRCNIPKHSLSHHMLREYSFCIPHNKLRF